AAVTHRAGTVAVKIFVIVRGNIAAREILLDPFEEFRIDGHQVFAHAVDGTFFHHPNLAIALDDLRFDLADFLVDEISPIFFATDDGFAGIFDATRTQRIRCARPAERRLALFPGFEQWLIRPFWREGWVRIALVEILNAVKSDCRRFANRPVK